MPTAGIPSRSASSNSVEIFAAPSSIEYSVCTCRWTKESATPTPVGCSLRLVPCIRTLRTRRGPTIDTRCDDNQWLLWEVAVELDLGAVRAFVAVAQHRHFGAAADELALTQQAISKRIAKLEADLGVALLRRTRGGAELTPDGNAFWPHARGLIAVADQATDAVRRRNRPLRVDVITTRFGPTEMVRRFHEAVDRAEIDLVTSDGLRSALPALLRGSVDAAFVRTTGPLDEAIARTPAELVPL